MGVHGLIIAHYHMYQIFSTLVFVALSAVQRGGGEGEFLNRLIDSILQIEWPLFEPVMAGGRDFWRETGLHCVGEAEENWKNGFVEVVNNANDTMR
jgi:hypothetical protein